MHIALELGDFWVVFPIASVWEVIERGHVVTVPSSHPFVEGLRLYRDHLIPVYNLRKSGLFPGDPSASFDFLLILRYDELYNGFLGSAVQTLPHIPTNGEGGKGRSVLDKGDGKEYFIADGKRHYLIDENDLYQHLHIL